MKSKELRKYLKALKKVSKKKDKEENCLSSWSEKNIMLNGLPFSFEGHEYLRQPYDDLHPFQVQQKAVQVGISTMQAVMATWRASVHSNSTGYFFPNSDWANRFSMRVKEEILKDSPAIMALMDKHSIDNVKTRKIGNGTIHFRGLKTASGTQETPMDIIIIDEFDHITDFKKLSEARQRTSHSELKWLHYVGIPTVSGWGINAIYQQSTQYNWNLICPGCGKDNILVDNFPECLKRTGEDTVVRICEHCKHILNTEKGHWIAKNPGAKIHGYQYTQLNTKPTDLSEVLYLWERLQAGEANPGEDMEVFYREILGLPYIMAENQLTAPQVLACCRDEVPRALNLTQNFMGIDTGKRQWRHVLRRGMRNREQYETIVMGEADWFQIYEDMRIYNIVCCVVDPGGNDTKVREFQADFPGRVFLCPPACYTARQTVYVEFNEDKGYVTANRTRTLDFFVNTIRGQRIFLPRKDLPETKVFTKHCLNVKRIAEVKDEQTGMKTYKWIRTGDDHSVHACNYSLIATQGAVAGSMRDVAEMNKSDVFKPVIDFAGMGL